TTASSPATSSTTTWRPWKSWSSATTRACDGLQSATPAVRGRGMPPPRPQRERRRHGDPAMARKLLATGAATGRLPRRPEPQRRTVMSNRTLTRSRLSLLVAAALFGASGMAFGQSSDPAEIPVDDLSVQADLDEDGLDDNGGNPDVEDDSSALADAQDPEDDDIDVDGDFDPEVDPDIDAHGGATGDADPMAMDEPAPLPDPIAVDAEDVDGAVVATD